MSKKWKSTKNHWTNKPKPEREKIMKKVSKGWGKKPKTGKNLICPICGKEFYLKPSLIKRAKVNYCSKKCFNESKKGKIPPNLEEARKNSPIKPGKDNNNWKGGISPYPSDWTGELRRKVFARDNNECQVCGKKGKTRMDLVVHHIDFNKENCDLQNLILLCRSCHMKEHWKANKGVPGLKEYNKDK